MNVVIPNKEELQPKPVSEGVYKAQVKMELKTSSTNKPMIQYTFTITSQGPNPMEKTIGRKVFDNPVIQDDTLWRHDIYLKAATGLQIPDIVEPGTSVTEEEFYMILKNHVEGKEVAVVVGTEVYEGVARNRVKEVKSLSV